MVKAIPESLREALALRADTNLVPYAGGTDLMVRGSSNAEYLFLGRVPELRRITADGETVRIGAAVTFTEALESDAVPALLKEAVSRIAAPAIRNAGTFGGNLSNGSTKADSAVALLAADARVRLQSLRGERILAIDEFCLSKGKRDLGEDELVTEILLPAGGLENYSFEKVGGRKALAISRVSFAGVFCADEGRITKAAAAFGAVSDSFLRFRELEARLIGKTIEEARELKPAYLKAYAEKLELKDGRVSAEYRRTVCLNLLKAFLEKFGV